MTLYELAKYLTPKLKNDSSVYIDKPLRDMNPPSPNNKGYIGPAKLERMDGLWLRCDGQPTLEVLAYYVDLEGKSYPSGSLAVLAFFNMRGDKPQLIDAMNVSFRTFTHPGSPGVFRYKAGCDAICIQNTRVTSDEKIDVVDAITLIDGKLKKLFEGIPVLYSGDNGNLSLEQLGRYYVDKEHHGELFFVIKAKRRIHDPSNPTRQKSIDVRLFNIPLLKKGKFFTADRKSKAFRDWQTFFKECGFSKKPGSN